MADNQENSWRTLGFRQNVRAKIEDAVRMSGNPTSKNPAEMENHVFQKAKTREEYLSYVARLIIHVREMNSKKSNMTGAVPTATMASSSVQNPGSQVSDPMSALRNMAGQGSGGTITIQSQPGQTQMTASLLGSGGTISQMATPVQPPPQVQVPSLGPGVLSANSNPNISSSSISQQGMNPMIMQQTRFLGSVGGIVAAPQMQQRPPMMAPNVQLQLQKFRQSQAQQGPPPNVTSTSIPHQGGFNENILMQSQQQPSPVSSQFQGHSPASMSNQGPNSNQTAIPSPVGHPTSASSQLVPSPAGYAPSPTSQIVPSPVGSYPARTPASAPSPGSTLNTPVGPVATPSPASRGTQEELYNEKRKQLSKYIEPLKKMIARIDKDENKKKELSRMKNLLDILADPNKRCPMEVLLKCEQVLEKMGTNYNDPTCAPPPPTVPTKSQEQNICQPLLDSLTSHIKSPLFNHTMQKTFGPAVTSLFGPPVRIPSPPPKRKKVEDDAAEISDVLQGEIARLDQRFKVQLDPAQHQCSRTVNLICQLDDKNIPCVPPIRITVPENYPDMPPQCNCKEEYESTRFLCRVKEVLSCHLSSMPQKYSITSLLDTWEMSVRQTCAPKFTDDEKSR